MIDKKEKNTLKKHNVHHTVKAYVYNEKENEKRYNF